MSTYTPKRSRRGLRLAIALALATTTASRLIEAPAADIKTIADMIPAGLRAMSLALTELDGAGGLIVPGQYVDVVAVFKKDTLGKDQSMIILQDVLVLAVAQATSADQ